MQALLEACAALSDPTPLAWLCARPDFLEKQGELLADQLVHWPETNLLKVLKGLSGRSALEPVLRRSLPKVSLDRLAVVAVLERTLKHLDGDSYEQYLQALEAEIPSERSLALLPARALGRLDGAARQRRAELAGQALEQLSRAPKAISLSNAEELLSKRVYTQPGHFLYELLQNAEDSGAHTFRVSFEPERVVVWHDGLPFDVRDVVGVTSIGQTTKKKQQIGFFGVGFKAVYEVTDRPQIYSDVFHFEIIDVSIPRALERPAGVPAEGTTLILPLKRPFGQPAPLDPGILLTLTNLRQIHWGSQHLLRQGDQVGDQAFLLDESEHAYSGGERESGRPDRTRLMLAVLLDESGQPCDPPEGAPTVYSYLPTAQPSGLRFLMHSHFDLPVDRERINPESDWNQWILQQIPAGLLRLAARADILAQLPLPGEAQGPFAFLPAAIGALFRDQPCLPEGGRPESTQLASAEMVELGLSLPLWAPEGRSRRVAEETLGCAVFGSAQLVEHLEGGKTPAKLGLLYQLLLPEVERFGQRLRKLPLGQGAPLERLARADRSLRQLWPAEELVLAEWDEHPLLEALAIRRLGPFDLLERLEGGASPSNAELALQVLASGSPEVRQRARHLPLFFTQFGLQPLTQARWCQDDRLREFYSSRSALLAHPYADWNPIPLDWPALVNDVLEGHLQEIPHELLEQGFRQVPEHLLLRLAAMPLWPDRPLLGPGARQRAAHPEIPQLLPERLFLPPELASRAHVQALTPQPVGVEAVLESMARGGQSEAALEFLVEHADEINAGDSRRLLAQAQLPDDAGQLAPLGQMCRAETSALRALYQGSLQRHFLGEAGHRLLQRLGLAERLPEVGLTQLVQDLSNIQLEQPRAVVDYLAGRAGELTRAQAETVLRLPLFPDRPLGELGAPHSVCLVEEDFLKEIPGVTLLEEELRDPVEELAAAALRRPAGPAELLVYYCQAPGRWGEETLLALLQLLARRQYQGGELSRLPLWPTLAGRRLMADEVAELEPLRNLMDCRNWELEPPAWKAFRQLLKPRPALEFLRLRLNLEGLLGRPLSEQPDFLATPAKVQKVADFLDGLPLVDGLGCLRQDRLFHCDEATFPLLAPSLLAQVTPLKTSATRPLPLQQVLQGLSDLSPGVWRSSPELRRLFYAWLLQKESEVFASEESRGLLSQHPLWLTRGGRLLAAAELILDAAVPDLGVDWYANEEIPAELQQVLARQLGVGQSRPRELLESHLLPAYREAAARGEKVRAQHLFAYLAEEFSDRPGLVGGDNFPVLDRRGRYRAAAQVLWPDPELGLEEFLDENLVSEEYSAPQVRFLRALGLAQEPSWEMLRLAFQRPRRTASALGLARLLAVLYRRQGEQLLQQVPEYRTQAWLPDALGAPRTPAQLFVPTAECESLIGVHGRLYPDPQISDLLGAALLARLGLRDHSGVELEEVLAHLRSCSERKEAVSFRVYQWLEKARFGDLKARLSNQAWIYTDDGIWMGHRRVLGVHAFTYFGNRRGYWERGFRSCPGLCALFEIPGQVEGPVVREFLEEIGAEVKRRGDREVLAEDKALPRMLLSCYTRLNGMPVDRKLPVVLAQARPGREKRLVAADHPALVSSDTPSLERLFEGTGKLLVAQTGNLEQRPAVEAFHQQLGLRNLRESYAVKLQGEGRDISDQCAPGLARLSGCLRALLAVLPRVRRQREQLSPAGWLDGARLRNVKLRAIQDLKVVYDLPGVGAVPVQAAAAYHEDRLLVDGSLVERPDAYLTGLAQSLLPCIYQGPGEEQLVDILEILLPLGSRERMDAYLDARHFPASEEAASNPLLERLQEILDFQLDQPLRQRFPELGELDPAALEGCETPAQAARALAGEHNAEAAAALAELFAASSLEKMLQPTAPPVEILPEETSQIVRVTAAPSVHPLATPAPEGLLGKLRNWFRGLAPASAPPEQSQEDNPYAPTAAIQSNTSGVLTQVETRSTRPPVSGLFHQPIVFPRPYQYAIHLLSGEFDSAGQRWLPLAEDDLKGFAEGQPSGRLLPFQGTLQAGLSRLPLPMYTRLAGELESSARIRLRRGALGEVWVQTSEPVTVSLRVELLSPPRPVHQELIGLPRAWLLPTLLQLPAKALSFVAANRQRPAWERALAAQEFVQTHYAYDAGYIDHPEVKRVLSRPLGSSGHRQLDVLHASAGQDFLGSGVCYELNAMVCELLRHLGVPSLLAAGWVLDEGFLEFPDHVFALAVLQSVDGPCLLPLDGTSSTDGPLRQLKRRQPPSNPIPTMTAPAEPAGIWGVKGTLRQVDGRETLRSEETQLLRQELQRCALAMEMVLQRQQRRPSEEVNRALAGGLSDAQRLQILQRGLREMLGPEVAAALLRLLAGDYSSLVSLPPAVAELVRLELAQVRTVPVLQVLPYRATHDRPGG